MSLEKDICELNTHPKSMKVVDCFYRSKKGKRCYYPFEPTLNPANKTLRCPFDGNTSSVKCRWFKTRMTHTSEEGLKA